jgi:hypothetical protein
MSLVFDQVLITGADMDLFQYSGDADKCIVVDWKGEDDLIVEDIAGKLEGEDLSAVWTDGGIQVNYDGNEYEIKLAFSLDDRYTVIRRMNEILASKYELRVFRVSLGSDTHCLYLKPNEWWREMERRFPDRIQSVFRKIDEGVDFSSTEFSIGG